MNRFSARRLRRAAVTWAVMLVALGAVSIVGATLLEGPSQRVVVEFLLLVGLVVGIQTFIGNSGVLSFGHVAFVGTAAYAAALMTIPPDQKVRLLPDLPSWLASIEVGLPTAVAVGIVVAVLLAISTGAAISRMEEFPMAMATLALLVMMHTVFANWESVTRGTIGILGIPRLVGVPTAFVSAALITGVSLVFAASPIGLRLQAIREDKVAAAAHGIPIAATRFAGWTISAALTGAAGAIWALNNLAFGPDQFFFSATFTLLSMLVIGGLRTVAGAVTGVALVTLLTELLRSIEDGFTLGSIRVAEFPGAVQLAVALLIMAVLIARPDGIAADWKYPFPRRRHERADR